MTEEWVSFWFRALSLNMDYSAYCLAREEEDLQQSRELEARFNRIAEIYEDFGELHGWSKTEGIASKAWRDWFEPRKHLFISASFVNDASCFELFPGNSLIELRLQPTKQETLALVDGLLTDFYKRNTIAPAQPPKYTLHQPNGRLMHGYEEVRQACIATLTYHGTSPFTGRPFNMKETMIEFLRHQIDDLGWTLDRKAMHELKVNHSLDEDHFASFKARINKCRQGALAMSRNTIRCRFPDMAPYKSNVIDAFSFEESS